MKRTSIPILMLVLPFLFAVSAKAQNSDYVVNNHGDTIKCSIKTPTMGQPKYHPLDAPNDTYIKITIEDIKEYYLAETDITIRRIYKDNTKASYNVEFLRAFEKGAINLYLEERSNSYSINNTTYGTRYVDMYVTKGSDTARLLKTSRVAALSDENIEQKNYLAGLLKDKKDVYDKFIKDNKFGIRDIQNIVRIYNTGTEIKKHKHRVF